MPRFLHYFEFFYILHGVFWYAIMRWGGESQKNNTPRCTPVMGGVSKGVFMNTTRISSSKTLLLVQLAIFTAIEAVFCFTPLGSLPISPGIVATLAHIPALVVAVTLGKWAALYMGGLLGLFSLIIWTFMPPNPAVAFVFTPFVPNGNFFSFVICVIPRAIFPFLAALLYPLLRKRMPSVPSAVVTGIFGAFIHSALVLSLIFIAFNGDPVVGGDFIAFILGWAGLNAVFEMIIAGIICGALILPLQKIKHTIRPK